MSTKKIHLPLEERAKVSAMSYENFMFFYVKWYNLLSEDDKRFFDNQLYKRLGTDKKEIVEKEIKKYAIKYAHFKMGR